MRKRTCVTCYLKNGCKLDKHKYGKKDCMYWVSRTGASNVFGR